MEKEIMVVLSVGKEPSSVIVEDPVLIGIDQAQFRKFKSLPGFELPKLHIIPKSKREELEGLVDNLVNELKKRGTWFGDDEDEEKGVHVYYMTVSHYDGFLKVFNDVKLKYNSLKDELVSSYDQVVNEFVELYKDANGENLTNRIKKAIPTKEQFESRFRCELKTKNLIN